MRKSLLVVSGVITSVVAAVFPNGTVDGLPISPHPRDHTQDKTPSEIEPSDIYVLDAVEIGNIVYIPVIVIPDEPFKDVDSGTTVSATSYWVSSLSNVTNSTAVRTREAGFTYPAIPGTGPRYANSTKPTDICTKAGTAKVTPSAKRFIEPSSGFDGSANSVSNSRYNLPGISTSTGSYSLRKSSDLPSSYALPKSPPALSQSPPDPWNPFIRISNLGRSAMDKVTVGTLVATFLLITVALIVFL